MSRSFQGFFAVLCIVAVFLTGIPLAKYISNQYFEFRNELNSQSNSLKYSSHENLQFLAKIGSTKENSVLTHKKKAVDILSAHDDITNSLQSSVKVKKRAKRRAPYHSKKLSWNFNLSVTRSSNNTLQNTSEYESNIPLKNDHLEVILYAKGQAQKQTALDQLYNALNSVQSFVRSYFADTAGNTTYVFKTHQGNPAHFEESFETIDKVTAEDMNIKSITQRNDTQLNQKGREPKFIFGFLGFGQKPNDETTQLPNESTVVSAGHEISSNDSRKNEESPESANSSNVELTTDQLLVETSHSEFSEVKSPAVPERTNTIVPQTNSQEAKKTECSDCAGKNFQLPDLTNETSTTSEKEHSTESIFSVDILDEFCMSLVNKLEESQQLSDEEVNEFDSEINAQKTHLRSENPTILDLLTLFNSIRESTSFNSETIEDSFLISNATTSETPRQSRFLNFNNIFGFGSGRSAISEDESNDLISGVQGSNIDVENLPSILDCENYFRKKQSIEMFPKPNLMDMMSDPKIQLSDFSDATKSSKLKDQNFQYLTDLLKSTLNNSAEAFDNLEDTIEKPDSERISPVHENFLSEDKILSQTNSDFNLNSSTDASTSKDEIHEFTQVQRDGRFFPIFGFGSGVDESPDQDSRFFLGVFGSGERMLETTGTETELAVIERLENEASDRDLISDIGTLDDSEDLLELSTVSDKSRRFLGFLGFGSGRQLEDIHNAPSELTHTKNNCSNDCSHEVGGHSVRDCNDCNYEDHVNNPQFAEDTERTNNKSVESINTEPVSSDKNLTLENFHVSENCNCFQTSKKGENFTDCDECSFGVPDSPNDYQPEKVDKTKSTQGYESNCDDCDHKHNLPNTETTDAKNISLLECDNCNYDIVQDHGEFFETIRVNQSTEVELCDDCNINELELNGTSENDPNKNQSKSNVFNQRQTDEVTLTDMINQRLTNFVNFAVVTSALNDSAATIDATEIQSKQETTEVNPRRFMGPIFLTGSGDGNWFGNDGGPINLVEEESTIIPPIVIPRRGRLDDIDPDDTGPCDDCNVDFSVINQSNPMEFDHIPPVQINASKSSKSLDVVEITVPSDTLPDSNIQNSINSTTEFQLKSCISASECNSTLNERCITVGGSSICDCGRSYVRHKKSSRCVAKNVVETSLKFPSENFEEDLRNPSSVRYKQMSKRAENTMLIMFKDNPNLLSIIADIEVNEFRKGSLIIKWSIIFAVETESEEKLIKEVKSDIQKALKDENLMQKASLDVSNASMLSFTSETNPCKSRELNYCSNDAYCVWNKPYPGRFYCNCKEHYRDVSINPLYPGETCIAKCPPEYCGAHGYCEIMANDERVCLCSGLYFGRRCEVPGMFVLGILVVAASVSILITIVVASRKRCTTRSYGGSQAFGHSEEAGIRMNANGTVSDAIALEENFGSKVTKYSKISTPVPLPVIRVTRPTFQGSSISFECDSTFEATPSIESDSKRHNQTS